MMSTLWCLHFRAFCLDSASDYNEDQDKKGLHFFLGRENVQNREIQDGRQRI